MSALYYNTNGFAFHRLGDAARILAEIGYDGIALTPDVHHLDPFTATARDVRAFATLCEQLGLGIVLETGARFVLDPRRKHFPTLLHDAELARQRIDMLCRIVDMAVDLASPVVSLWSGAAPEGVAADDLDRRLHEGLREVCDHAARRDVRIGFEPEPGMWIERADAWPALRDAVDHASLGLTLDVGHCLATGEGTPHDAIRAHARDLLVIQLDDHRPGVHDHLAFGEGAVDFDAVAAAVQEAGFSGPLEVELSRHSANACKTAEASWHFLRQRFPGEAPAPG